LFHVLSFTESQNGIAVGIADLAKAVKAFAGSDLADIAGQNLKRSFYYSPFVGGDIICRAKPASEVSSSEAGFLPISDGAINLSRLFLFIDLPLWNSWAFYRTFCLYVAINKILIENVAAV